MNKIYQPLARKAAFTSLTAAVIYMTNTPAFALDKIYSPNVVKGEFEMEYFGTRSFDKDHDKNNIQKHEISVGYGVTDYWQPELYVIFEKNPDESAEVTGYEFENRFQLAQQGQYWVDPGLLLAYTHAQNAGTADELELKLLLEKKTGSVLNRANIGIGQEIGSDAKGGPERSILWSSRYVYNTYFAPGFEVQSNFGKASEANNFKNQEHYAGPAAYGNIARNMKYEAAYLFGVSNAAANSAARLLVEYEIHF
jgi:hypothetical protein